MKIIVSPAKTMRVRVEKCTTPHFIEDARIIRNTLKNLNRDDLAKVWKCNDKIIDENINLLNTLSLDSNLTKAVYAYDGLQFKNLEIESLDSDSLEYLNDNLFILSAMYGALRVNDGVIPYRLEMQAKLKINDSKIMYSFWKNRIYDYITRDDNLIINLASKEYSDAITPYVSGGTRLINISFGSIKDGKLIIKSTESKIMRGRFLRFMAEVKAKSLDDLKAFNYKGMRYSSLFSTNDSMVFVG